MSPYCCTWQNSSSSSSSSNRFSRMATTLSLFEYVSVMTCDVEGSKVTGHLLPLPHSYDETRKQHNAVKNVCMWRCKCDFKVPTKMMPPCQKQAGIGFQNGRGLQLHAAGFTPPHRTDTHTHTVLHHKQCDLSSHKREQHGSKMFSRTTD